MRGFTYLAIAVLFLATSVSAAWADDARDTVGWVERVKVEPGGIVLPAKLDTGADNSSIHAPDYKKFTRNRQPWVRFEVTNRYGQKTIIEAPVVDTTRVKSPKGNFSKRLVIRLGICLNKTFMEVNVSLSDRGKFDYQLLVGRSYLAGHVLIDPSVTYLTEPKCVMPKQSKKS